MDKLTEINEYNGRKEIIYNNNLVRIFQNSDELFSYAADDFVVQTNKIIKLKNECTVVLSGGETPKYFYQALVSDQFKNQISWNKIKFFFVDERYVSHDSNQSNYHLANEFLFSKVNIPKENIFPIPTHFKDPNEAAISYEEIIRNHLKIYSDGLPKFDLVYLGLGEDAHTASLMPNSSVVVEYIEKNNNAWVQSLYLKNKDMFRITLTPTIINNAHNILFLVTGENKSNALKNVLEVNENFDPKKYPAQLIQCINNKEGNLWYVDKDAASALDFFNNKLS